MSDTPTEEQIEQIADALAAGRKIEAIKIYREATGKGLAEAKEFIDALVPKLQEQDPERFAKLSQRGGCASVILFCVAAATAAAVGIIKSVS